MLLRRRFALLMGAAVLVGAGAAASITWSVREARQLSQEESRAAEIARQVTGLLVLTHDYLLHAESRARQQWLARHRRLLEAVPDSRPAGPEQASIRGEAEQLLVLFTELVRMPPPGQDSRFMARRRELLVDRLLSKAQALSEYAYAAEQAVTRRRESSQRRLMALAVATPTSFALLLSVGGWQFSRRMLIPLSRLQASIAAVTAGNLSARAGSASQDEFGELARQFDRMTSQLAERTAALRASESMLRLVTDNIPAMIGYWDEHRRNRFANADYRRWFGKSPEEIHGRHMKELLGPDLYAKNKPHIEAALAGQRQDFDRDIPGPDGVVRHSQASYIPDVHDGRVEGFFVLVTDITERVHSEQALAQLARDREVLLKEVYHRVKNNLQVVQSLLRLQGRAVSDAAARGALADTADRVRAMVLVHEQLYRSQGLSSVALPRYVEDLVRQLLVSSVLLPGQVDTQLEIAPLAVGLDSAVPLGLLLSELVSNSLKHAFPDGRKGVVRVAVGDAPGGQGVLITVVDNGLGLPEGFDLRAMRSTGLQLASALAGQLGGELHFESKDGTRAWLIVPRL